MDIIFSETERFDVRRKFENYKYLNLNEYLKMLKLPETWKNHEKEFREFLKACDISEDSIDNEYDKLPLFYAIFLAFKFMPMPGSISMILLRPPMFFICSI